MRKFLIVLAPLLLNACTWGITPDDGSQNVRTAWTGDVSACRDMGKITVSVMDRVGPIDRNPITVRDELEVMARNQAAQMHADTIRPLGEPVDGSQPWGAYQCGARMVMPEHPSAIPPANPNANPGGTQTFPVHGG